jgi:hypothetical protein
MTCVFTFYPYNIITFLKIRIYLGYNSCFLISLVRVTRAEVSVPLNRVHLLAGVHKTLTAVVKSVEDGKNSWKKGDDL